MHSVRTVCAHDCPDMCSLIAHVDKGRVVRIEGDPDQPLTAGFACGKVNRDTELVHSPERLTTPLRRTGPKGSGEFAPISWEEALDEITRNWNAIIAADGPMAILGYAYSAHQGLMNRGLLNGLFHALGTSRLLGGTVCDSCAEAAWDATVGPGTGGADPESVTEADLVVSWGSDLHATNVHLWAKIEQARKRGAPLVVIDPRRTRAAQAADWHLPIRIGTDSALALGVMHILVRDGKTDEAYLAEHTIGFDRVRAEVLPRFTPTRTAAITGGYVALHQAFKHLMRIKAIQTLPLIDSVAAVSCGIYEGTAVLDLDYAEDSSAEADANFVLTGTGGLVEIQATAEKTSFSEAQFNQLLSLARSGTDALFAAQRAALGD